MKKLFLLIFVIFTLANQDINSDWFDLHDCTIDTCKLDFDFPEIHKNSNLTVNQTISLGTFRFEDISNVITLKKLYNIANPVITTVVSDWPLSDNINYLNLNPSQFSVYSVSNIASQIGIEFDNERVNTFEGQDNQKNDIHFFSKNKTFTQSSLKVGQIILTDKDPATGLISIGVCAVNKLGEFNIYKPGYLQYIGSTYYVDPKFELQIRTQSSQVSVPGILDYDTVAFRMGPLPMLSLNQGYAQSLPSVCNLTYIQPQLMSNGCLAHFNYFPNGAGIDLYFRNFTLKSPTFYINGTLGVVPIQNATTLNIRFPGANRYPMTTLNFIVKWNYTLHNGLCSSVNHTFCGGPTCKTVTTDIVAQTVTFTMNTDQMYSPYTKNANITNEFFYVGNTTGVTIGNDKLTFNLSQTQDGQLSYVCTRIDFPSVIISAELFVTQNCSDGSRVRFWSLSDSSIVYSETPICIDGGPFPITTGAGFSNVNLASTWTDFCVGVLNKNLSGPQIITMTNFSLYKRDDNSTNLSGRYSITPNSDCLATVTPHHIRMDASAGSTAPRIDTIGTLNNCTWLTTPWLEGEITNTIFFREFKNGKDQILPFYDEFKSEIGNTDPDYSLYGTMEVPNNNYSSCPEIKNLKTEYKSKNTAKLSWNVVNECVTQNYTTFVVKNEDDFAVNGICTGINATIRCSQTLKFTKFEPITVTIAAVGDQYVTKQYRINYKWADCQTLCFWPFENLNIYWKTLIWSLIFMAIVFMFLTCTYPCFAVLMFCEKCIKFIWKMTCCIFLPFKKIWQLLRMIIVGGASKLTKSYSNYKNKNTIPSSSSTEKQSSYREEKNNLMPNLSSKPKTFLLIILLLPLVFGCDNEILTASNITSCINNVCDVQTDIAFTLPATVGGNLCVGLSSVETNLGVEAVKGEKITVTVLDFFLDYPIEFSYYAPYTTKFNSSTGCDCPDGSSHSCTDSHHPAGAGCKDKSNYCWYRSSSGTGDNCGDELLFGDGHYCNSFSLTYDTLLAIGPITNSPTYHFYLQVCQTDSCENVWHNTTGQLTHQMFENQVLLTIGGFFVSTLPDFSGYSLIKSAGSSWVGRVNQLGDYALTTPSFVQKWGPIGGETWHLSESNINAAFTLGHDKCWDTAKMTITYKIPVFSSWLTQDKTLNSFTQQYGKGYASGYGPGMTLIFRPLVGPTSFNQITSQPGWVDIRIDAACPIITDVFGNSLYEESTLSSITTTAYSDCGEGSAQMTIEDCDGCSSDNVLPCVIESTNQNFTLPVTATKDTITGKVCITAYFEKTCKDFTLDTIIKNSTDGFITDTTTSEGKKHDDSGVCLTCFDSWFNFGLDFGSITDFFKSILIILVWIAGIIIGVIIFLALTMELLKWSIAKVFGQKNKKA